MADDPILLPQPASPRMSTMTTTITTITTTQDKVNHTDPPTGRSVCATTTLLPHAGQAQLCPTASAVAAAAQPSMHHKRARYIPLGSTTGVFCRHGATPDINLDPDHPLPPLPPLAPPCLPWDNPPSHRHHPRSLAAPGFSFGRFGASMTWSGSFVCSTLHGIGRSCVGRCLM